MEEGSSCPEGLGWPRGFHPPNPGSANFPSLRHPVEYRRFLVEPDVPGRGRKGNAGGSPAEILMRIVRELLHSFPPSPDKFTRIPLLIVGPGLGIICTKKRPLRVVPET